LPSPTAAPARTIRAVIANRTALGRAGLRAVLAELPNMNVLHAGPVVPELADVCAHLRPDLLILDTPDQAADVATLIGAANTGAPGMAILVVSAADQPAIMLAALRAGARGYLTHDASEEEIRSGVGRVLRGAIVISEALAAQTIHHVAQGVSASGEPLTLRERDVLALVARGQTNRAIAAALSVSVGTVKIHVEHILAKLGVTDRTQAAVHALEHRLI
jgi:DNA-binding NarL/FixJ family response regulator